MDCLAKVLRDNNMKVTPQRMAIYEVLANTNEHPCAETIHRKLSSVYPTMSLATIYKSIDVFKKAGLIQELNVGECSFRYEVNTKPHAHIICTECRKVENISDNLFTDLVEQVGDFTNYNIEKHQLFFYGKCPNCL